MLPSQYKILALKEDLEVSKCFQNAILHRSNS